MSAIDDALDDLLPPVTAAYRAIVEAARANGSTDLEIADGLQVIVERFARLLDQAVKVAVEPR